MDFPGESRTEESLPCCELEGIGQPEQPPRRKRRRTRTTPSAQPFPIEGTLIEGLLKQQGISELAMNEALILPQLRSRAKRAEDLGLPRSRRRSARWSN